MTRHVRAGTPRLDYVTPNTLVTYQWRAIDGDEVVPRPEEHDPLRGRPARPRLAERQLGEATVHWYGDAEAQARASAS